MAALVHRGAARHRYAVHSLARQQLRLARQQSASFAAHAKSPADSTTFSSSSFSTSSSSTSSTLTRGPHSHTHEVNKSKFVAKAFGSVSSTAEALSLIKAASARDASHNSFAFVIQKGLSERCSDDGEPAGTAGRPILGAVSGEGLENAAVLVSRWRSGPKLGPGGLSRAYGAAARDCLRGALRSGCLVTFEESCVVEVVVPVDAVGGAYTALSSCCSCSSSGSEGIQEEYGSGNGDGGKASPLAWGLVRLRATVPRSAVGAVSPAVAGASGGKGVVSVVEDESEEE